MPTLNYYSRLVLIWIILSFSVFAYANNPDISFRRITINDGLSLSSVYYIYQDSKGFMWFATEDGLNKYDGENFTIYSTSPGSVDGLTDKWIETIVEDKHGIIWLGSRNGLSRLDPTTDNIIPYKASQTDDHSLASDSIVNLCVNDKYLWVGTKHGLNRINTETLVSEEFDLKCDKAHREVLSIRIDNRNRTWIGTNGGVYVNNEGEDELQCLITRLPSTEFIQANAIYTSEDTVWIGCQNLLLKYIINQEDKIGFKYQPIQTFTNTPVQSIYKDSRGHLWVQTIAGLYLNENSLLKSIIQTPHRSQSLSIRPQKPLIEDSQGNIWLGTFGDGIYIIKDKMKIIHIRNEPTDASSLSDNSINCLFEDRANGVWVGTFGAGINIYDPNSNLIKTLSFNAYDDSGMSSSFVWSIHELQNGNVWIGTNRSGINIFNPANESFRYLIHDPADPNSLPNGDVREIFQSRNGTIWVGVENGGLSKYDPIKNRFHHYKYNAEDPGSISSNSVRTIFEDSTGILWIGTRQGLNKFNPKTGKFIRYLHDQENPKSISYNFIYSAIYMDKRGMLWIGTYGGGLNKMNPRTGEFTCYHFDPNDPSSISDDIIFSIYEDEKGYFWIGTNSGLNLFNPSTGKFKRYGLESGLPNEVIYGIMPDNNNRLWITTNKGISRLDLTEFRFKNFDVTDGLQSNEFNGGAFHKGNSGLIYAGGVYGLNIIDPEKIVPVENNAELIISRLEILGKDVQVLHSGMLLDSTEHSDGLVEMIENYYLPKHVTYLDVVRLNYKQRFFSIEFAALNHHIPQKLNYRYRMQNLEEHWNNAGSRNYVTYANMKPGSYIFEVDASNSDGKLTDHPAQLKIIISPPFWRSYWFMLMIAMLVLLFIIFIYRYLLNQRMNKILKVQFEQIKIANQKLQISESNLMELNATKDKFFSIISHDLKNPFASVLSISELLNDNFEQTQSEELKYGLKKIHQTNKHIYELLENLLTWSKTQRGNIKIEKTNFNLSKLIETNINILKLAAEKKSIVIENTTNDDLCAYGDREMVSTVFRNLLNNAVKFTPSGKKIRITASENETMIHLNVIDEGIGISKENLDRLFKIEDKYKTNGTNGEKGTGLGLIICKEFVERNGGSIEVSSTPDKGSTFQFTIPKGE